MGPNARVADVADFDAIVNTISVAFFNDPVWSWVFSDADQRREQFLRWWPLFVGSAIPHGFTWVAEGAATIAVWTPPNRPELSDDALARLPGLLDELLGPRAPRVLQALLQFDAVHPHDEPHYYLGFVATHDDHRGGGIGERLLGQNLALVDAEHMPAYLESSNPKNLARYGRLGFVPHTEFMLGGDGPTVTTMWRPAR
jgi:GNAT superfamily N-acetyltransferase